MVRRNEFNGPFGPLADMGQWQAQVGRLFEAALGGADQRFPRLNIWKDAGSLVLQAEVPGLETEDIELLVEEGQLVLRGEVQAAELGEDEGFSLRERPAGKFERRIRLPFTAATEAIEAQLENGLLTVRIAKSEQSSNRISIQGA